MSKLSYENIYDALAAADDDQIMNEYDERGLGYDRAGDLDTNAMIDELEGRGFSVREDGDEDLIAKMYEKYRRGENIDAELREMFFLTLGRIA